MSNLIRRYLSNAGITATAAAWVLFTGMPVWADDTEIYFGQPQTDPDNNPNVLLIIDSSGSMDGTVWDDIPLYRDRLAVVQDVTTSLINEMENVNIGMMKYDIAYTQRPGWQDDYDLLTQGGMVVHPISDLATNKTDLTNRINAIHHFGSTPLAETYYEAGQYFLGGKVDFGADSWHSFQQNNDGYTYLSPLNSHADSYTGSYYDSPFKGACQRNFIVYLSDGAPTRDDHAEDRIETLMGDAAYDGHSSDVCLNAENGSSTGRCIDEFAEFLYKNDFDDSIAGTQNVISHFIGFNVDLPIFAEAASRGGGNYYQANNADQLREDLTDILREVADSNDGFTAPAITVNAFDRTSHLDQLFFTVFKPTAQARWNGNLKKYKFQPKDNDDGLVIVDADGDPAVDPTTGFFYDGREANGSPNAALPKARSYWSVDSNGSPIEDGATVSLGGASSVLPADPDLRKLYTAVGTSGLQLLKNSSEFQTKLDNLHSASSQNTNLTSAQWGQWAVGYDVNDDNEDGSTSDARKSFGAPLHSKPAVVVYGGTNDSPDAVIFMGTNDGMLHAISSQTGEELWGFMPEEMWDIVPELAENEKANGDIPYGVDGHIVIEKKDDGDGTIDGSGQGDRVYLYFGMRRGGTTYYKLDVTDYNQAPTIEWKFDTPGESWTRPVVAKVNFGTDDNPIAKKVVLVGGGYDPATESSGSYTVDPNAVGNSIHMLDAETGNELWRASDTNESPSAPAFLAVPDMKSPIPSSVRVLDLNLDGYVDRMYVNDIAGRLFRFDIHTDGSSQRVTAGVIAELGGTVDGGASDNRRFYYAPDVALSSANGIQFLTVTTASGYRAHPLNETISDYLTGVRDYNVFNKLGTDISSDGSEYDYGATLETMSKIVGNNQSDVVPDGAKGWYRSLGTNGQKALARSRIFQNKAYFTTYTPGQGNSSNPCAPAVGTGKLYTIDLRTGQTEDVALEKPGIPPEITFIFGESEVGDIDDCFGAACDTTTGGGDPTEGGIDPPGEGTDDQHSVKPGQRDVECLAGPESCIADAAELPKRTFWRQTTDD